ncbi:BRICHOS domain-containing protein 5 [Osmerus eperlanus]|uniref:BRICHOS domain-containing protein 5 n=1 Tax=Osmerus eperlanus TaxID=29151 RepID=UPI002E10FF49
MVRCWERSQTALEDSSCTDGSPTVSPQFPHKAFWAIVSATLLLVLIALSLTGHLGLSQQHTQSLQVVRITAPDLTGSLVNQSALVDRQNDLVTISVSSQNNHTSTVLFDIKHGVVCYKPDNQETCFLRNMEKSDYENMNSLLLDSTKKESHLLLSGNHTQRQTEFLGVLGGRQVDPSSLEQPFQALCQNSAIYWTRRADGPAKQRLVYFCIDICFPSNICVSVCFYYLPE